MKVFLFLAIPLVATILMSAPVTGRQSDDESFSTAEIQQEWERFDLPIAAGQTERTWTWGEQANPSLLNEPWVTAPLAQQGVQYFDKGRLVLEVPSGSLIPVFSTQLTYDIVTEMMMGTIATGNDVAGSDMPAASMPVAGDLENNSGPTYSAMALVQYADPLPYDTVITERIDLAGSVTSDDALQSYDVRAGEISAATNHRIADVFWEFLTSSGIVWQDDEFTDQPLYDLTNNPLAMTGQPITEAFWTTVPVLGMEHDVLIQCFERRCMTYTPTNPEAWQIEFNNAGQHYVEWRYRQSAFGRPTELSPLLLNLPMTDLVDESGATSTLSLEVAESSNATRCGLMHRLTMPENHGMLFVFDQQRQGGFWNRNTFIPLTLAWIGSDFRIVDLTDMQAAVPGQSQEPVTYTPVIPYQYVIEANQGWFAAHDIGIGDLVELGPALQTGQTTDGSVCEALGF